MKALKLMGMTGLLLISLAAQTRQDPMAQTILNAVSKKYKKMAGFRASFTHDSETNTGKVVGVQKGSIAVAGARYRLKTDKITLICDGKTAWSINPKAKEVTISDYEPEADDITPERIYSFYQKGYKYIFMGEIRAKDGVWQTIDLEPENLKKEISKIRLYIDKSTLFITKWIVYERGSNNREIFEVKQFEPLNQVNNAEFAFSAKQFPGHKVIDLR